MPSDSTLVSSTERVRWLMLTTTCFVKASLERRWGLVWYELGGTEQLMGLEGWGRRDKEDPMGRVEGCGREDCLGGAGTISGLVLGDLEKFLELVAAGFPERVVAGR